MEMKHWLNEGGAAGVPGMAALYRRAIEGHEKRVDRTTYFHRDALGSPQVVTNQKGEVLLR